MLLRPIVRHRGCHDREAGFSQMLQHGLVHFASAFHIDALAARRGRLGHRPGDQDHARSTLGGLSCEREAHPPAGAIRDIANRVQRFARGSGSDQHALVLKIAPGTQRRAHGGDDVVQLGQSAGSDRATGEFSHCRLHDAGAARPEGGQVLAGRGMFPHVRIHGRRQHERTAKGKMGRAEEIIGEAQRELGQHVRGGGRDQQDVSALSDIDVGDCAVQCLVR